MASELITIMISVDKLLFRQSDNSDAFCSADEEFDECDGPEVKPTVVVLESVPSKEILEIQVIALLFSLLLQTKAVLQLLLVLL